MTRDTITAQRVYYDDEVYYLLPSGFVGRYILVNESSVDFSIRHIGQDELLKMGFGRPEEPVDVRDYPLPEWAERFSDGNYMEVGAQLPTRDGRRVGNAFVQGVLQDEQFGKLAVVVTDAGNVVRYTEEELRTAFYPPQYICLDKHRPQRKGEHE